MKPILCLIVAFLALTCNVAAEDSTSQMPVGLVAIGTTHDLDPQLPETVLIFRAQLAQGERTLQTDGLVGGHALQMAAQYYALLTHDFKVTLEDVINAGLWPYRTFPSNVDMQATIAGGSFHPLLTEGFIHQDKATIFGHARFEVLRNFYRAIYEKNQRIDVQGEYGALDTVARYDQFWVNPFTGQPMKVSDERGDITEYQLNSLPKPIDMYLQEWVDPSWLVPLIN